MYTRVHLCTIVHGFCTVLRGGRGRGRDAALLHPPATCQLETIPYNSTLGWVALVDGGDVTGTRQPGWMRLQTRPFAVGANLPKHWKDGRWVITDQFGPRVQLFSDKLPTFSFQTFGPNCLGPDCPTLQKPKGRVLHFFLVDNRCSE